MGKVQLRPAAEDELQTAARPASQRFGTRCPSGRPFTTLHSTIPCHALQTYPPTGCKQPSAVHNLIDGSVHNAFHLKNTFPQLNQTHTYARSLEKNGEPPNEENPDNVELVPFAPSVRTGCLTATLPPHAAVAFRFE